LLFLRWPLGWPDHPQGPPFGHGVAEPAGLGVASATPMAKRWPLGVVRPPQGPSQKQQKNIFFIFLLDEASDIFVTIGSL
jgi:hypothetical protein